MPSGLPISPQANIPRFNPFNKGLVQGPEKITGNANTVTTLYDRANTTLALQELQIQNVGTTPMKVCLNGDAGVNAYHKIIPGGSGAEDGLGGDWTLEIGAHITKVTALNVATGFTCVLVKVLNNSAVTR